MDFLETIVSNVNVDDYRNLAKLFPYEPLDNESLRMKIIKNSLVSAISRRLEKEIPKKFRKIMTQLMVVFIQEYLKEYFEGGEDNILLDLGDEMMYSVIEDLETGKYKEFINSKYLSFLEEPLAVYLSLVLSAVFYEFWTFEEWDWDVSTKELKDRIIERFYPKIYKKIL